MHPRRRWLPARAVRLVACLCAVACLCSCIKYAEEWTFSRRGSGTVRITCEPSPAWLKLSRASDWWASSNIFIPSYAALSQSCARAGLTVSQCRYETHDGKPRVDIVIDFPSLRNVAQCSLFADRTLQWRQARFTSTVLYSLRAYPDQLSHLQGSLLRKDWFADATVEIRMTFPGRVLAVEGAQRLGRSVVVRTTLNDLAQGKDISIFATARTGYPWGWVIVMLVALLVTGAWIGWRILTRRRPPPPAVWQPGQVNFETQC